MNATIREMLRGYVKSITIETNLNEPFTIDDPFAETPPGVTDEVVKALQPKVTLHLGAGLGDMVIAPGGVPSGKTRSTIQEGAALGGVVVGVAGLGLVTWLLTRRRR